MIQRENPKGPAPFPAKPTPPARNRSLVPDSVDTAGLKLVVREGVSRFSAAMMHCSGVLFEVAIWDLKLGDPL